MYHSSLGLLVGCPLSIFLGAPLLSFMAVRHLFSLFLLPTPLTHKKVKYYHYYSVVLDKKSVCYCGMYMNFD